MIETIVDGIGEKGTVDRQSRWLNGRWWSHNETMNDKGKHPDKKRGAFSIERVPGGNSSVANGMMFSWNDVLIWKATGIKNGCSEDKKVPANVVIPSRWSKRNQATKRSDKGGLEYNVWIDCLDRLSHWMDCLVESSGWIVWLRPLSGFSWWVL